jgi:signal transduction histidine kinase
MTAPAPHDNADRLAALRRYDILDTPPEEAFDGITRLLAHVCRAPVAVINFVDEARQWFKSEIGLGVRETPLDISFCAHAILRPGLFIVPDTTKDERFSCNPLVTSDPHLRFYAGALLETSDGFALGTICVLDTVPRDLDGPQRDALRTLARQVMSQLELRRELAAQARVREELRRASEAAERANAAKDRFLATLSHELRTPLSPVLLAAAEWASNVDLPEALRGDLAMIHRNVELETRLIDDLLDLTRIVSGKLRLHPEPVRVHPLLTSVLDICAGDIFDKDLQVECDLRAADDRITADPARLQQVLWNLLKNATKFTPDGGWIRVVTSGEGRGRLRIEVRDSGVGIPPDALPRVFEAFEQGGEEVTHRHGGLGLGLAISRAVVDLHGGTIRADAAEGGGCRMVVELPR